MITPWELVEQQPGSCGYLPIQTQRYRLPDGTQADWDIYGTPHTVAVLALTEADEVVLARQFRPGPGKVLDELPGGFVDEGEDVLAAAARELLEETGFVGEVELAGTSWLAAASQTQRHVVVVRAAQRASPPTNHPGEFCEVLCIPLTRFRDHLRSGQLTDVDLGYLALDHLGLLR